MWIWTFSFEFSLTYLCNQIQPFHVLVIRQICGDSEPTQPDGCFCMEPCCSLGLQCDSRLFCVRLFVARLGKGTFEMWEPNGNNTARLATPRLMERESKLRCTIPGLPHLRKNIHPRQRSSQPNRRICLFRKNSRTKFVPRIYNIRYMNRPSRAPFIAIWPSVFEQAKWSIHWLDPRMDNHLFFSSLSSSSIISRLSIRKNSMWKDESRGAFVVHRMSHLAFSCYLFAFSRCSVLGGA